MKVTKFMKNEKKRKLILKEKFIEYFNGKLATNGTKQKKSKIVKEKSRTKKHGIMYQKTKLKVSKKNGLKKQEADYQ